MLTKGALLALLLLRSEGAHAVGTCLYTGTGIGLSHAEADVMAVSGSGRFPVLSQEERKEEMTGASPGSAIVKGSVKGKSFKIEKIWSVLHCGAHGHDSWGCSSFPGSTLSSEVPGIDTVLQATTLLCGVRKRRGTVRL